MPKYIATLSFAALLGLAACAGTETARTQDADHLNTLIESADGDLAAAGATDSDGTKVPPPPPDTHEDTKQGEELEPRVGGSSGGWGSTRLNGLSAASLGLQN